jgi:hypothetical protein
MFHIMSFDKIISEIILFLLGGLFVIVLYLLLPDYEPKNKYPRYYLKDIKKRKRYKTK